MNNIKHPFWSYIYKQLIVCLLLARYFQKILPVHIIFFFDSGKLNHLTRAFLTKLIIIIVFNIIKTRLFSTY